MAKSIDRALLKAVIGIVCVLSASAVCAQHHPVLAAENNLPTAPSVMASNSSSSRLPADETPATPIEAAPASPFVAVQPIAEVPGETTHRFWDRENTLLFAAVAAGATADFFTTHANLASGGQELNPIARMFTSSTPLLATNFGLETAGVIGISYMFHKTGHHKLERLTSFVDLSGSVGAVTYGLTNR